MSDYIPEQPPWLGARTIFLTRHGSHAYGTATPASDLDVRGLAIAPSEIYLGFLDHFEQAQRSGDPDVTVFELRKFFALAANCNPNALELLFTDPSDHIVLTYEAKKLIGNRDLFLSRQARHTFSGYAHSQLLRIKGHHRWLRDPPKAAPTRAEFDLPEQPEVPVEQREALEAVVRQRIDSWQLDLSGVEPAVKNQVLAQIQKVLTEVATGEHPLEERAARVSCLPEGVIAQLQRERAFHNRVKDWSQYQEWKRNRNPDRAALETRWGYDTKHGMHLVRLLRMGLEILRGEGLRVRRPDAAELLEIRNGAWSYEQLLEFADKAETDMVVAERESKLPRAPDRQALHWLCYDIVSDYLEAHP